MVEPEHVTELVQRDSTEIEHARTLVAAIGVPAAPLVKDDIRLRDGVVARRVERLRHRHHARPERFAKDIVCEAHGVESVAGRNCGRIAARAEGGAVQIRIPRGERRFGDAVPVGAAVDERGTRRAQLEVHDDGVTRWPVTALREVGAAGIGEQKDEQRDECDGDSRLHFFLAWISPPMTRERRSESRATGAPSSVITRSMPPPSRATFINPWLKPTIGLMLRSRRAKTTRPSPTVKAGIPAQRMHRSGVSPPRKSNASTRLVVP